MKAVLISIRPKWCELIASGKKTVEVRKTAPKIETPFKCYIYETKGFERVGNDNLNCVIGGKGRGAVVGEFVCDEIARYARYGYAGTLPRYMRSSQGGYPATEIHYSSLQLSPVDLERYGKGTPLYGWHISALKMYDEPKKLTNFIRPSSGCCNEGKCTGCAFLDKGNGYNVEDDCFADFDTDMYSIVTRPPQSWMYVEELTP